jgi:hypothetical protein
VAPPAKTPRWNRQGRFQQMEKVAGALNEGTEVICEKRRRRLFAN